MDVTLRIVQFIFWFMVALLLFSLFFTPGGVALLIFILLMGLMAVPVYVIGMTLLLMFGVE